MHRYRRTGLFLVVSLLFTIYTLSNSGGFHIIDEVSLFAVTESLAQRGEVDTNAIAWTQWVNSPGEVLGAFGPGGEVYSKKGPAPAFLSVPWYSMVRLIARLGTQDGTLSYVFSWGLLQGTLLWNGFVTAGTAVLLWLTALRLGYNDRTGVALALLFGLGTIAWPYANHFFGEPLSAFGLLLCFYGLVGLRPVDQSGIGASSDGLPTRPTYGAQPRWSGWLAGLGAALAIGTVTAHSVLVVVFGVYLLYRIWVVGTGGDDRVRSVDGEGSNRGVPAHPFVPEGANSSFGMSEEVYARRLLFVRYLAPFALPVVAALLLLGGYNFVRFGSVLDTGYHFESGEGFTTPIWQGAWGLLVSPYRGLFWHTPLFLVSLFAFPSFLRRHFQEGLLVAGLSAALIGMYSMWWMWWGGFAWGPRFLVPLAPLWVLVLAPFVSSHLRMRTPQDRTRRRTPLDKRAVAAAVLIGLSFAVQISAVVVNYVNYEIELRSIFPTDWTDPLEFGPPAQAPGDWLHSPVLGQWRLMVEDFRSNTDLAWFWSDGTVLWPVVITGTIVVTLLVVLLYRWWRLRDGPLAQNSPAHSGMAGRWPSLVLLLPVALMAVWLTTVGQSPRYGPPQEGYRALLDEIGDLARTVDGIITVTPYHYQIPMNWLGGVYPGGMPVYGYAADSAQYAETIEVLSTALQEHGQIWYVTAGLPPADPTNTVERWLAEHAFKADDHWYGDFRLVRYGTDRTLAKERRNVGPGERVRLAEGNNRVILAGAAYPPELRPGRVMPVELHFAVEQAEDPLRWFVQVLGEDGLPVAQVDTGPSDGYIEFAELGRSEAERAGTSTPAGRGSRTPYLIERVGLLLPSSLPPGTYRLIAGLYNPAVEGAPRLTTAAGSDFVELGTFSR